MNELGIVILILLVMVITLILFRKSSQSPQNKDANTGNPEKSPAQEAKVQKAFPSGQNPLGKYAPKDFNQDFKSDQNTNSPKNLSATTADLHTPNVMSDVVPEATELTETAQAEVDSRQESLPFGDDKTIASAEKMPSAKAQNPASEEMGDASILDENGKLKQIGDKHYVLEVDDPFMTGEKAENEMPTNHEMPNFGKPDETVENEQQRIRQQEGMDRLRPAPPQPKAFVLVVKCTKQPVDMQRLHHIMLGLGARLNHKNIYTYANSKKVLNGDGYVTIANLLEPGTFPVEGCEGIMTPGVVLILELPTFVAASAAMHDMIMLSRKLVQHLDATLMNAEMQPVKESYLQTLREASLEYDSERLV